MDAAEILAHEKAQAEVEFARDIEPKLQKMTEDLALLLGETADSDAVKLLSKSARNWFMAGWLARALVERTP